ncbi:methyltransferase [Methylovirgula ligni]|uniref:tRNA1(Val) A37 N6-methylase TrmN6 n=1 Tax=Methylovirgula ligni TaxID=569860 RepID=A0A3D9YTQ4_9HYPH|nr:methyltransferase [Methylovirgula ligni]QAY96298.1 methyltransferase [Methylovirgula ligni]REF85990.1 tRNA1(Val) A37 N6-methylase TrmN6 [Methylovirgula ligni]
MAELAEADFFLGRQLRLRQLAHGHRAGTDAVLLAAAAPAQIDGLALDVGAGVGAAGLALARLRPGIAFGLVENDAATAALARENLALNQFDQRGTVYETDVLDAPERRAIGLADGAAALVITNPPFLDPARARLSPDAGKRAAHAMTVAGPQALADWLAACLALLRDGGTLVLIHRPDALPAILAALEGRAGAQVLISVQPRVDRAATRILLRAQKGSRGPLTIAPPLVLHEGERFTAYADAIHRGTALIDW